MGFEPTVPIAREHYLSKVATSAACVTIRATLGNESTHSPESGLLSYETLALASLALASTQTWRVSWLAPSRVLEAYDGLVRTPCAQ